MYRVWLSVLVLVPLSAPPVWSQDRPTPPPQVRMMRQQVEREFADQVRRELRLTDEQATRLRATTEDYAKRREGFRARGRTLEAALAGQLQPGIAANNDSVTRLVDELVGLRMSYAENVRSEMKDLSKFLTPVQRARFFLLREQLLRNARDMRVARERRMGEWSEGHKEHQPH